MRPGGVFNSRGVSGLNAFVRCLCIFVFGLEQGGGFLILGGFINQGWGLLTIQSEGIRNY